MGEDLVLYKDLSGQYGLLDRHCPHRRADLSYGIVEECGLRCNYHGWLFDATGTCIEQPFEDIDAPEMRFRDQIRIKAYKVQALAGLLWAYLGPEPAPLVPNWEPFTWKNGFVQIVFSEVPCNWFQCQENSIDPVHFEWMHDNWSVPARRRQRRLRAAAPEAGVRRVRLRLGLSPRARRLRRDAARYGRSAASACGRMRCSPATISNGACRSTTPTR